MNERHMAVLNEIERAARNNEECPTNVALTRITGASLGYINAILDNLIDAGFISVRSGSNWRVVTILESGLRTATPKRAKDHHIPQRKPAPGVIAAPHPVYRDPCPRCGVRRDYGCKHFPLENNA